MAVYAKSGSLTAPVLATTTSTATTVVSGLGFSPRAVLFITRPLATGPVAGDAVVSVGTRTAASQQCVIHTLANAVSTTVALSTFSTSAIHWREPGAQNRRQEGNVTSLDSNGFTITFGVPRGAVQPPSGAFTVDWHAFGGDISVNAGRVTVPATTAAGSLSITSGFTPRLLITAYYATAQASATVIEPAVFGLSVAAGNPGAAGNVWTVSTASISGRSGSRPAMYTTNLDVGTNLFAYHPYATTSGDYVTGRIVTLSGYTATGATLAYTSGIAAPLVLHYLAIGGLEAAADFRVVGGGNQTLTTAFRPIWSLAAQTIGLGDEQNAAISIGATDGTSQTSTAWREAAFAAPTAVGRAGYGNRLGTTMTGQQAGAAITLQSLSATGATVNLATSLTTRLGLLVVGDTFIQVSGETTGTAEAASFLSKSEVLSGTVGSTSLAEATALIPGHPLAAEASGSSTAAASLAISVALTAAVTGTADAPAAVLSGTVPLAGVAGGSSQIESLAELLPTIPLSATVEGTSGHDVWLGPVARLTAATASTSAATASLSIAAVFLGDAVARTSDEDPTLLAVVPEVPQVRSLATASGLRLEHPLAAAAVTGTSAATGVIGVAHALAADATGASDGTGLLAVAAGLAGDTGGGSDVVLAEAFVLPYLSPPAADELPGALNLVRNPSLEYDVAGLTDWDTSGDCAIQVEVEQPAWHGAASVAAVYTGAGAVTVTSQRGLGLTGPVTFAASIAVQAPSTDLTLTLRAFLADGSETTGEAAVYTGTTRLYLEDGTLVEEVPVTGWYTAQAVPVAVAAGATVDRVVLEVAASSMATVRLDAAQVQLDTGSRATAFVSGDLGDGYQWGGIVGLSVSLRQPQPLVI